MKNGADLPHAKRIEQGKPDDTTQLSMRLIVPPNGVEGFVAQIMFNLAGVVQLRSLC